MTRVILALVTFVFHADTVLFVGMMFCRYEVLIPWNIQEHGWYDVIIVVIFIVDKTQTGKAEGTKTRRGLRRSGCRRATALMLHGRFNDV